MGFFTVTTTQRSDRGDPIIFVFATEDADDLSGLRDALAEDGSVVGQRYRLQFDKQTGSKWLAARKEILLTLVGIEQIVPYPEAAALPIEDR